MTVANDTLDYGAMAAESGPHREYELASRADSSKQLFGSDDEAHAIFRNKGKDSHMCDLHADDISALYNKVNRREDSGEAHVSFHPAETWHRLPN